MSSLTTAYVGSDGYLYLAGHDSGGQLGNGTTTSETAYFKAYKNGSNTTANYFKDPIGYGLGGRSTFIIDSDGKVWATGTNSYGQLGRGSTTEANTFGAISTSTTANYLPSNYKAVAVSTGAGGTLGTDYNNLQTLLLTDDGGLYGAGTGNRLGLATTATTNSTFRRLDGVVSGLPANTISNPIKDFSASSAGSYVLYENGDLYFTSSNSSYAGKWTKLSSDIVMIDSMEYSSYIYMYNEKTNMIQYHLGTSSTATDIISPIGSVTQIKGGYSNWGYLNDNGDLYLSSTSTTTMPGASNATTLGKIFYTINDIAFFDLGGYTGSTYMLMTTDGNTKSWGSCGWGILGNGVTSTSTSYALAYNKPFVSTAGGGVPTTNIPDLPTNGLSRSNPPAWIFL